MGTVPNRMGTVPKSLHRVGTVPPAWENRMGTVPKS